MKSLKTLIKSLHGDVIRAENAFLLWTWSIAIIAVLAFGFIMNSESVSFLGIAESRELQVNFSNSVEIKNTYVIPGQIVKKGELLLELNQSDLEIQLRTLKSRHDKLLAEIKLRQHISAITGDSGSLSSNADPLGVELADTQREINLLEARLKNLYIFAEVDGAIGAVNFKTGEKAPAFAPLITLSPLNPSFVNGYINEQLNSEIAIGQTVEVLSASGKKVQGVVASVGSRIVPIPERLLRIQTLTAWGREVTVKIPRQSGFLLGEKVTVKKPLIGVALFSAAQADAASIITDSTIVAPTDISVPTDILEEFEPEMSGLTYVPDLKKFALISDDYPNSKPFIFLMDDQGELQRQMLPIEGLERIDDLESISSDANKIYLMSSMSSNKKGVAREDRELFVEVKRDGLRLTVENQIYLKRPLLNALAKARDPLLQKVAALAADPRDFEIEGHTVYRDDLYLALKKPVIAKNMAIVVKIESVSKIFALSDIPSKSISLAFHVSTPPPQDDHQMMVTDLTHFNGEFFVSATCAKAACSSVYKLDPQNNSAISVQNFNVRQLEGLGYSWDSQALYGVFDNKTGGKFMRLPLPLSEKPK